MVIQSNSGSSGNSASNSQEGISSPSTSSLTETIRLSNCSSDEEMTTMVNQVNLAAAYHDHISCTKLQPSSHMRRASTANSVLNQSALSLILGVSDHMYATDRRADNGDENEDDDDDDDGSSRQDERDEEDEDDSDEQMEYDDGDYRTVTRVKGEDNENTELRNQINRLKDVILVQLDLIQHQQEQLLKKDRQLQGLKQDREALCLRLEKMEKRIAHLTNKLMSVSAQIIIQNGDENIKAECKNNDGFKNDERKSELSSINISNETSDARKSNNINLHNKTKSSCDDAVRLIKVKTEECDENDMEEAKQEQLKQRQQQPTTTPTSSGRKRSSLSSTLIDRSVVAKKRSRLTKSVDSSESNVLVKRNGFQLSTVPSLSSASSPTAKEEVDDEDIDDISSKSSSTRRRRTLASSSKPINSNIKSEPTISKVTFKDILWTPEDYDVCTCRESFPCELTVEEEEASKTREIEVPSWRLHPVSSCYSLEGTENLDDDVFGRRHSKLEIDEKRRKRWDIQRLREQKHNEKLRTGRYYSGNAFTNCNEKLPDLKKTAPEIISFFPDPRDVQYVEICDKIPMVAFGHPVPRLAEKNYTLPWSFAGDSKASTKVAKKS